MGGALQMNWKQWSPEEGNVFMLEGARMTRPAPPTQLLNWAAILGGSGAR